MISIKVYVRYSGGLPHKRTEVYKNNKLIKIIWQALPKVIHQTQEEKMETPCSLQKISPEQ